MFKERMKIEYKKKHGKSATNKYIEGHRLRGWAGERGRMRGTREDKKGGRGRMTEEEGG